RWRRMPTRTDRIAHSAGNGKEPLMTHHLSLSIWPRPRAAVRALLAAVTLAGVLGSAPAFAQGTPDGDKQAKQDRQSQREWHARRGAPGAGFLIRAYERHADELKRDPRVLDEIRAIGERDRQTLAPMFERSQQEHARMRELLTSAAPDERRVFDQADVI